MLCLIGLGLYDTDDISLKGLNALKDSHRIYAEFYTSLHHADLSRLEKLCGKRITTLKREDIEEHPSDNVLKDAQKQTVSLLVPGDPMVATTHIDLIIRAEKAGIKTRIIHSSSVYSAIAETGLQIYKFGKTTTLAYPERNYFPTSPYDVIKDNQNHGLHTLVLLDVKAEQKRYMTAGEAIGLLLRMEEEKGQKVCEGDTRLVGVARLGGDTLIRFGSADSLQKADFGKPPHVLVVPGELHYMEEEALARFKV